MEDAVLARLGESESHESECRTGHHGGDRPVPVRAMRRNGNVDMLAVLGVGCLLLALLLAGFLHSAEKA